MPLARDHQHISSDIVRVDAVHTSIDPSGGGSISATDGVTTVDPATSIVFPAGTLADLGAGVAGVGLVASLLGPLHVTYQSVGINGSGDGHFLVALPADVVVIQHAVVTTQAWAASSGSIDLQINIGGSLYGPPDDNFRILGASYADGDLNPQTGGGSTTGLSQAVFGTVSEPGALIVQTISDVLTAGEADIYAIITTPAS